MVNDKYQWLPNGKMISTNTNDNEKLITIYDK